MVTWQKVYSAEQSYRAEIVKYVLEDAAINAVIINKKDSSYNNFGTHEVHVSADDVMKALQIIKNDIDFK